MKAHRAIKTGAECSPSKHLLRQGHVFVRGHFFGAALQVERAGERALLVILAMSAFVYFPFVKFQDKIAYNNELENEE